jgi:hypothetical protein
MYGDKIINILNDMKLIGVKYNIVIERETIGKGVLYTTIYRQQ